MFDLFWKDDISILYNVDRLTEFFPSSDMNFDEKLLFKIVKTGFQQRRKTLRNSLKSLNIPKLILEDSIFDLRPEKLSGDEFIALTKKVENAKV